MRLLRKTGQEDGLLGKSLLKVDFMDFVFHIPRQAEEIIEKLNSRGFEAYVVGGCVRDCLLGREPEDWDITTSARPEQVKELFGRTVDTGIRHGTVTVMRGKRGYEVTTFRIDGEYKDGRHPSSVEFTSDLLEDLRRRDFTINAMAYSGRTGLVDAFGGLRDLDDRRIRCVGDACDRFGEDALRMLRALRFSAQLGFETEKSTEDAVRRLAPNLRQVSRERVQTELTKLLLSDRPDTVRKVFEWGLAPYVSETFAAMDAARISVSPGLPAVKHMRWAACLRQLPAGKAVQVLRELKLDNDTIAAVRTLTEWWNRPIGTEEVEIRRTMSRMSPELYDDLLVMKEAVAAGYGPEGAKECEAIPEPAEELIGPISESAGDIARIRKLTEVIRGRGDCVSLKELAVTGSDLLEAGMKPGPDLGRVLEGLLNLVLEHPEWNTKQRLMEEVLSGNWKKTT